MVARDLSRRAAIAGTVGLTTAGMAGCMGLFDGPTVVAASDIEGEDFGRIANEEGRLEEISITVTEVEVEWWDFEHAPNAVDVELVPGGEHSGQLAHYETEGRFDGDDEHTFTETQTADLFADTSLDPDVFRVEEPGSETFHVELAYVVTLHRTIDGEADEHVSEIPFEIEFTVVNVSDEDDDPEDEEADDDAEDVADEDPADDEPDDEPGGRVDIEQVRMAAGQHPEVGAEPTDDEDVIGQFGVESELGHIGIWTTEWEVSWEGLAGFVWGIEWRWSVNGHPGGGYETGPFIGGGPPLPKDGSADWEFDHPSEYYPYRAEEYDWVDDVAVEPGTEEAVPVEIEWDVTVYGDPDADDTEESEEEWEELGTETITQERVVRVIGLDPGAGLDAEIDGELHG